MRSNLYDRFHFSDTLLIEWQIKRERLTVHDQETVELISSERTIEPVMANLLGVVFGAALTLGVVGVFRLTTGHLPLVGGDGFNGWAIVLGLIAVGVPLHELLHAAAFCYVGGVRRSDIIFGFNRRALAPYVHCRQPVSVRTYRIAAALPGVTLGIVPLLVATVFDSGQLFAVGYVLLLVALSDAMLLILSSDLPAGQLVQDHKSKPGFVIVTSRAD